MQIIRGLQNLIPLKKGSIVTIGNYDGIHLGHQQILRYLQQQAHQLHLTSTVITFNPQPREFFSKNYVPQRLMNFREKILSLEKYAIDKVLYLHFNHYLANIPATKFIEEVLVKKLNIKYIVIGDDFAFGHQRTGTMELLKWYGVKYNFQVKTFKAITINDQRISSTQIRNFLAHGNLKAAQEMLGNPYYVMGRVIHGDKRGHTLGYPTANIHLKRKSVPLAGVYAVKVWGINKQPINGVVNVGFRPTVKNKKRLLEVYLLDFNADIYGKILKVEFMHKLRNEIKFSSLQQLKQQIARDIVEVKNYFASHTS